MSLRRIDPLMKNHKVVRVFLDRIEPDRRDRRRSEGFQPLHIPIQRGIPIVQYDSGQCIAAGPD